METKKKWYYLWRTCLPGYNDIVQQSDLIQSTLPAGTYRICILHGQMDSQKKKYILRFYGWYHSIGRTSIFMPDLAYIIDSGKVKMKNYDSITESSQLSSVWISKADANQPSGRSGGTQNGVWYRLYSRKKSDFMTKFRKNKWRQKKMVLFMKNMLAWL